MIEIDSEKKFFEYFTLEDISKSIEKASGKKFQSHLSLENYGIDNAYAYVEVIMILEGNARLNNNLIITDNMADYILDNFNKIIMKLILIERNKKLNALL